MRRNCEDTFYLRIRKRFMVSFMTPCKASQLERGGRRGNSSSGGLLVTAGAPQPLDWWGDH